MARQVVWAAGAAWAVLLVELWVLAWWKEAIQGSFCGWALWLRTAFPLGPTANAAMAAFHSQTNSFNYMQLATAIAMYAGGAMQTTRAATESYVYVLAVHIVKNFGKSFIQSPRGFWYCTEGHAISCGAGYSLPSGHSTMSLALLLFLLHRLPQHRRWILPLGVLFEIYTVFEIMYLGTHTPTDIVVGFTVAVAVFLAYRLWELPPVQSRWNALMVSPEVQLCVGLAAAAAVYRLEVLEDALDAAATHSAELQANYTAYCNLVPGTAAQLMRNSTAYSKTAIVLGLSVAWYLRRRLRLDTADAGAPALLRAVRTAAALAVFTYSKALVRAAVVPALVSTWEAPVKFLPYAVQPLIVLVLAPAASHVLGLGPYMTASPPKLKRA